MLRRLTAAAAKPPNRCSRIAWGNGMSALRPGEPAVLQAASAPTTRRVSRSLRSLLAGVVALPVLLIAGSAWHGWQQAWAEAEAEMLRAAEVSAEYMRRML